MSQNQNLVPDIKSKLLLVIAVVVVATIGLFERRTLFTLTDGTVLTGQVVEETPSTKVIETASGTRIPLQTAQIASEKWFNLEVDLNLGLDLKGGTALRYRIDLDNPKYDAEEKATILDRTVDVYNKRLDSQGVRELSIRAVPEDEILIELPGISMEESQSFESVIMKLGALEFRIQAQSKPNVLNLSDEEERLRAYIQGLTEAGESWTPGSVDLKQFDVAGGPGVRYRWYPYTAKTIAEENRQEFPFVMLEMNEAEVFSGSDIERTYSAVDEGGRPALGFEIKSSSSGRFGEFTESHQGEQMAIVLDGQVSTAPTLESRIDDQGRISGGAFGFTQEEVKALRTVLESGSLEVKPELLSKATIGPTLGQASIDRGVLAGVLAGVAVVCFVGIYYLGVGIISCITLLLGMYLLIGGLGFLGATLTLPGIAGILLTVGMAVDQNILINERIREERGKGKTLGQAIKNGFERAFVTIFDAQVTTFIAGFILYQIGTGPIRGFAVTLMLGIVTTMFASLLGSRVIFAIGLERGIFKQLRMLQIIGETRITFTRYLRMSLIFSGLVLVAGLGVFGKDYHKLQGLDFAGGFQANIRLAEPMRQHDVHALLAPSYKTVLVVEMSDETGTLDSERGSRNFRITIPMSDTADEATEQGDLQGRYLDTIEEVLRDRLIPEGIADIQITEEANQSATARFTINLSEPIGQQVIEGRLKSKITVTDIAPANGTAPVNAYAVTASFGSGALEDDVRTAVTTSLLNLPDDVRLSDPIPASQTIGGKVGKELTNSAIKAVVLAIIMILIYIRIRFRDFTWGLAACVAAAHDVLFCLGCVALFRYLGVNVELDLAMVGAFLTIIGYSLNDTIVIFDRVRENLPRINKPLDEVVNLSINQTLARTLLTSITTLIAVMILFVLNIGQRNVLEGFAFIIMVGVLVGTYSTIFIASPMLVWLHKRAEKNAGRQRPAGKAAATAS